MTVLCNEVVIDAPVETIWEALSNIEELEKYDPTVKKSIAITTSRSGIGAARKVEMQDGKNWFEERCTVYKPNEALAYELTACSFPISKLKHSYEFEVVGKKTRVKQVMEYQIKFGLLGKLLDTLVMRNQSDQGIKKFFVGLKSHAEQACSDKKL